MFNCRVCDSVIKDKPLLHFENMPKSAQFFPVKKDLNIEYGADLDLVQCPYCGMLQLLGEPVSYYREVIRASSVSEEMAAFRYRQFADWMGSYGVKGKKVLEIGCGHGEYMKIMAEIGAEVYGIEYSSQAVKYTRQHGYRVFKDFVEDAEHNIENAPYDAFYILNFLEHIPQPANFLRGIAYNLVDDAVGLVEVPNVDMIIREGLYSELIQDHLLYFTQETLCQLLRNNGFEVLNCRPIWHDYILSAQVKKRHIISAQLFEHKQAKMQASVDDFLKEMESMGKKIAAWGAGHQALANFALLHMAGRLECVIDSAPFKQNKFTPGTHIPVVSPEVLAEGRIGAILVMAAGYSDEIADKLAKEFPDICCGILRQDGIEMRA